MNNIKGLSSNLSEAHGSHQMDQLSIRTREAPLSGLNQNEIGRQGQHMSETQEDHDLEDFEDEEYMEDEDFEMGHGLQED